MRYGSRYLRGIGFFAGTLLALTLGLGATGCRGSQRCALDERFDESGHCVAVATCPTGRDPDTGLCRDSGLPMDAGGMDSSIPGPNDAGSDGGSMINDGGPMCPADCGDLYCNDELGVCAECLNSSQCPVDRPACDTNGGLEPGRCGLCTGDDQCSERTSNPVCDEESGHCVVCTPDTEMVTCGGFATCRPGAFDCNGFPPGTREICETCESDSECQEMGPGNSILRCVEFVAGQPERYCLPDRFSFDGTGACPPGYPVVMTRTGTFGDTAEHCLPELNVTTCAAIRDALDNAGCSTDAECGEGSSPPDGQCAPGGGNCLVSCNRDAGCPVSGTTCNTTVSPGRCE